MSEQTAGTVPAWTRGDRLRKARENAGLQQQQLADEIGVSRRSVSAYEGDVSAPRRPVLLAWSMRTGVPIEWLSTGHTDGTKDPGSAMRARQGSNLRPSDYNVAVLGLADAA